MFVINISLIKFQNFVYNTHNMGIKDFSDKCSNIFVSQCIFYNPTYNLTLLAQYRCSIYNLFIYFLVNFKLF